MESVSAEKEVCCDIQLPEKQMCLQRRQHQVYTGRLLADVRLVGAGESRGEKKKNVCHLVVVVIVVCEVLVGHGGGEITIQTSNTSLPSYLYGGN